MAKSEMQKAKDKEAVTSAPAVPAKSEVRAIGRYLKISPTKVRDLLRLIRNQRVDEAEVRLKFASIRGGRVALKVLRSAAANAGAGFRKEEWTVADARADKGPLFRRRVDPKSRGSRGMISTPSTHLTIVIRKSEIRTPKSENKGAKNVSNLDTNTSKLGGKNGS